MAVTHMYLRQTKQKRGDGTGITHLQLAESIGSAKKWDWLYKDYVLSLFSEKIGLEKKAYIEFVSQKEREEIDKFYSKKKLSSVLGDDDFKEWIKEKFQDFRFHCEMPEPCVLAPDTEKIIDAVSRGFKTKKEPLVKSRRGTINLPRDRAVYFLRKYITKTLAEVDRYHNISNYSTVSSIIGRVKARRSNDKTVANQLKKIEKALGKGQKQTG